MSKFIDSIRKKNRFFSLIFILFVLSFLTLSTYASADDHDSDGLNDIYEDYLGSDYTDSSDVVSFTISDSNYYLVDVAKDGVYDVFCSPLNGYYSDVETNNGVAFIDVDGDQAWDYTYQNGELVEYSGFFQTIWFYVVIIIAIVAIILLFLFKMGFFYVYEEEYIVEK